ncbi:MAG TPA: hypothetical protein ENN29_10880 [Candidatus Hydrogenedentes bacterium]|nr:hypothetical protein [Candidatus Hydrogenedentota bacterium]
MRTFKHLCPVTKTPEQAQISNFQVKLEFTTAVIDRLLLVDRQSPWKIVPGGSTDIDDITRDDINIRY